MFPASGRSRLAFLACLFVCLVHRRSFVCLFVSFDCSFRLMCTVMLKRIHLIWGSLFKLTSSWPPARVEGWFRAAVDDTWSAGSAGSAGSGKWVPDVPFRCRRLSKSRHLASPGGSLSKDFQEWGLWVPLASLWASLAPLWVPLAPLWTALAPFGAHNLENVGHYYIQTPDQPHSGRYVTTSWKT